MCTSKRKGIYLLFEGLPLTVIESQVLVNARAVSGFVEVEVWSFAADNAQFEASSRNLKKLQAYGLKIRLFRGLRTGYPLSEIFNGLVILKQLLEENERPAFIHARTEYSVASASFAGLLLNIPVIWDCRGDLLSEFKLSYQKWPWFKKVFAAYKFFIIHFHVWLAKLLAKKAIFVSSFLKERMLSHAKNPCSYIIPCTASSQIFFFSQDLRQAKRDSMGFLAHHNVLVYSGSLANWQCFDDVVKLVRDCFNKSTDCRAIILTPNVDEVSKYFSPEEAGRLVIKSVGMGEVNDYLNAADFAIFLRKEHPLNRVASPVKFAEYCLTGLPIIMTRAVRQSSQYANQFGNFVSFSFNDGFLLPEKFPIVKRQEIAFKAKKTLARESYNESFQSLYEDYCYEIKAD